MYFEKEKEVCSDFTTKCTHLKNIKIAYNFKRESFSIIVNHKNETWDDNLGRKKLNVLIKRYNLAFAFIGYKNECLTLRNCNYEIEYMIPMSQFNLDNYYSEIY